MNLMEDLARHFFGEPNEALSKVNEELRFGTHGSMSVHLQKQRWFDHEADEGGGPFDLIVREEGITKSECPNWLRDHGFETTDGYGHRRRIVATYDYTDENGKLLYQSVRYEPKGFSQRRPDGKDWIWSTKGVRQVPFRLPELLEAIRNNRVVMVVEGEKDVNNLWKLDVPATTNVGGAKKFRKPLIPYFHDADVVIIADNDDAGREHAEDVASKLWGTAQRIRILDIASSWPSCPPKGDISDWIKTASNTGTTDADTVARLFEIINTLVDYDGTASKGKTSGPSGTAQENGWGRLTVVCENEGSKGNQYFARLDDREEHPIEMRELMYMSKFQEWTLKFYKFVPRDILKNEFQIYRDEALSRVVERETPVGVKPEEQTAAVVMRVLKFEVPVLLEARDAGRVVLSTEYTTELITIKEHDFLLVGAQKLLHRIKGRWLDQRMGCQLTPRMIADYLKTIPGCVQFGRVTGRMENVPGGNKMRSKYAVPIEFIEQYEMA